MIYWIILTAVGGLCFAIIVYLYQFYDKDSVNARYFQPFKERHEKRFGHE